MNSRIDFSKKDAKRAKNNIVDTPGTDREN